MVSNADFEIMLAVPFETLFSITSALLPVSLLHQLRHRDLQRLRELHECRERWIMLPDLQAANVRQREPGLAGQHLLGPPARLAILLELLPQLHSCVHYNPSGYMKASLNCDLISVEPLPETGPALAGPSGSRNEVPVRASLPGVRGADLANAVLST